ncbi:MAG: hypothetical protein ACK2TU_05235 [Anaerolineales bacterium]
MGARTSKEPGQRAGTSCDAPHARNSKKNRFAHHVPLCGNLFNKNFSALPPTRTDKEMSQLAASESQPGNWE